MADVVAFIDGFNLYHALDRKSRYGGYRYHRYKWLNYWELAKCFAPQTDTMSNVFWFTAECPWLGKAGDGKRARWRKLKLANENAGVSVIEGHFRPVTKTCKLDIPRATIIYDTYEEKRTDVAIAVSLVAHAYQQAYNKAILITADSDLIPAIVEAKRVHPQGQIINVVPIEYRAQALKNHADSQISMRVKHLKASRLPAIVTLASGNRIGCPGHWVV